MKTKLLSYATLAATISSTAAGPSSAPKTLEAQRRMDPTGMGSFHRIGLLREAETTRRLAAKAENKKAGTSKR